MSNLRVSIVQTSLHWENPSKNRDMLEKRILSLNTPVDLIILPEMFTTGFTMNPTKWAEPHKGVTFRWMEKLAREKKSVIAGSIATDDKGLFYNRLIWMQPDGNFHVYDKRHLFSHSGENRHYSQGSERVTVNYKGWKILLLICYDLRFPVWIQNKYSDLAGFDYDCILCVANWPAARSHPWRILLMARAIENQCYVIGVNRIGEDGNGVLHTGDSALISPLGENISNIIPSQDTIETILMTKCQLDEIRQKFNVARDWDKFEIK